MFEGRKIIIATKHKKELVIAPLLESALGLQCFTDDNFDTDILGTFTGEVERELDPISTVREKCLRAMRLSNCDLGVASEGSFGPHPNLYFACADEEFLIFIDLVHDIEIIVREQSTETNFNGKAIHTEKELLDFAHSTGFPEHALILRKSKDEKTDIQKGITDPKHLKSTFSALQAKYGTVYVETDMRAMYNPTRMGVIAKAVESLIQKINSKCPKCQMPGYGVTDSKSGLRCSMCGMPTSSILSIIYECRHCHHVDEQLFPYQKTSEDPMFCNFCNP